MWYKYKSIDNIQHILHIYLCVYYRQSSPNTGIDFVLTMQGLYSQGLHNLHTIHAKVFNSGCL